MSDPVKPELDTSGDTVDLPGAPQPRPTLRRGVCVGRYVLIDPVGEGGMGVVFKAYDPELERAVALKLLHAGSSGESRASVRRERLLREAKALARLSHPNVLAVFDVGMFEDDVFLATEFVEGRTFGDWARDPARKQHEIVRAAIAAGEGLAAAHRAGLVHRDFKPSNVIVGNDGRVRVLDFGLARSEHAEGGTTTSGATLTPLPAPDPGDATKSMRLTVRDAGAAPRDTPTPAGEARSAEPPTPSPVSGGSSSISDRSNAISGASSPASLLDTTITQDGQILGTPRFMAPEQHLGRTADARSDQFAFCVSLYEALYREFPFEGRGDEYADNVVHAKLRPAPAQPEVPRRLRQILVRGLAREPGERHASMDALLDELRHDPRVARRRWLAAGAAVLALAGVAFASRHTRGPEARCAGAEQKLAGVWDAPRRSAMHDAFVATRSPDAEDAFQRASSLLDQYAARWVGMHTDACEATHVRGEQSAEMLDLRVECLRARLEDVRAQVDVFTHADESAVERAVRAALALPRLDPCADGPALRAAVPPPTDAKARARVDEIRADVARATALQRAGKYAEARSVVERAVIDATPLDYAPLEGEALYVLGDVQDDTGDYALAEKTLSRAVAAAMSGHDDTRAARALNGLVAEIGLREMRFDDAHEWAIVAEGQAARVTDAFARGELLRNEGRVLVREARPAEARAKIEQCLAIWEPAFGADAFEVSGALTDLGNVEYLTGKFEEAIATYGRSLTATQKIFGDKSPLLAPNENNIGDSYGRLGDWEHAREPGERARALWEGALGPEHPKVALALTTVAASEAHRGELDLALTTAERALAIWTKALGPDHADVAMGLHSVADVRRARGELDLALATEQKALGIREKALAAGHDDIAESLIAVGEILLDKRDPTAAAPFLERALTIREAHPGDPAELGDARFALARAVAATDPTRSALLTTKAHDAYASAEGPRANAARAAIAAWEKR